MLIGDFNGEPTDTVLSDFCETYNLKNKVKDKTCFENSKRPSCIDLIVTNKPKRFQTTLWLLKQGYLVFTKCELH